jgi:hypothetical protein
MYLRIAIAKQCVMEQLEWIIAHLAQLIGRSALVNLTYVGRRPIVDAWRSKGKLTPILRIGSGGKISVNEQQGDPSV